MANNDDTDERTTAMGFYNYAISYHDAAMALRQAEVSSPHRDAPITLYYHAIELFLKSFLRLKGLSARMLAKSFGHNVKNLGERAAGFGLLLCDHDKQVLEKVSETGVILRSRYIVTGYYSGVPTVDTLYLTCRNLRRAVHDAFRNAGQHARP